MLARLRTPNAQITPATGTALLARRAGFTTYYLDRSCRL